MSARSRRRNIGRSASVLVFITTCGPDDQFSSPRQIRCCPPGSTLAGKLLVSEYTNNRWQIRNADLSFHSKVSNTGTVACDSDALNIYSSYSVSTVRKHDINTFAVVASVSIASIRMIDASGDPDYVYVTSNNADDGHGVRKVRKSDMTVVASLLATGAGDGQFNNPLGVKYYGGFVYVCDFSNSRIVKLNASDLSFVANVLTGSQNQDLDTDGTNWYTTSVSKLRKWSFAFGDLVQVDCVSYSLCIIPDQSDGYGATLAITDTTNSHLARYKCSDLSLINEVGSSGDGSSSMFDPVITGSACTYVTDEGEVFTAASGSAPSKNGFTGIFFRNDGPHRVLCKPTNGLAAVTAIDSNTDLITTTPRNLYKCKNLTSLKLQTNTALVLDLSQLSSKLVTLWAYGCGAGIFGSIRHMIAATSINLRENGASQAQVDAWIDDLYSNKDILGIVTVNLNGSNAPPSVAGKAKADELINDYAWTFAYTT